MVYYSVFQGTSNVKCFYELLRVSFAGLRYFLRQFFRILSLFPWSYSLDQLVLQGGVRKSHFYVFCWGLDPGQAPLFSAKY